VTGISGRETPENLPIRPPDTTGGPVLTEAEILQILRERLIQTMQAMENEPILVAPLRPQQEPQEMAEAGFGGGAILRAIIRAAQQAYRARLAAAAAANASRYVVSNGFRFTQYYWERLWATGITAPGLRAEWILQAGTRMADPQGRPGFFKYVRDGWEMIYNPLTREVHHLRPFR